MKPYPDLVPHQLYVVVYPEDRWVFFHAVDEDVGLEYHLSKYRGRWHCSTLYMTVHDIAQLCGVVIQLGLRGNHNEDGVSKSLLSTKVPVPRIQPPKEDSDSSSESESDGVPEMDHMQWFKDAVRKMAEDGVVECTDLRSLEIDIQIQTDEYWILREKGERLSMLPIAFFIR